MVQPFFIIVSRSDNDID